MLDYAGRNSGKHLQVRNSYHGQTRFTSPAILVEAVRGLGWQVRFKPGRTPGHPFAVVPLDDIEVEAPEDPPELPSNLEDLVDMQVSCSLCYECIEPRAPGSSLCLMHTQRLDDLVNMDNFAENCMVEVPLSAVRFQLPENPVKAQRVREKYALLSQQLRDTPSQLLQRNSP